MHNLSRRRVNLLTMVDANDSEERDDEKKKSHGKGFKETELQVKGTLQDESVPASEIEAHRFETTDGKNGVDVVPIEKSNIFKRMWRNNFIARICRTVGIKYVIINLIVYGLDEGSIESFNELGRVYYYKYRGFSPAETQRAIAWTDMVKSKSL